MRSAPASGIGFPADSETLVPVELGIRGPAFEVAWTITVYNCKLTSWDYGLNAHKDETVQSTIEKISADVQRLRELVA